jgi:hypothetical protein
MVIGAFPLWYPYGYALGYGGVYPLETEAPPTVYIEREPPGEFWYYCRDPRGYYPYVAECPGGWVKVPPQPGPDSSRPSPP